MKQNKSTDCLRISVVKHKTISHVTGQHRKWLVLLSARFTHFGERKFLLLVSDEKLFL